MTERLAVLVLGNRNAGKTTTWKTLFEQPVKTVDHDRELYLSRKEYVEVRLVSGSAEETHKTISQIIGRPIPRIVLCSVQYRKDAIDTFNYFLEKGFYIYLQWLNPGRRDEGPQPDHLGFIPYLLHRGVTVAIRNGKNDPFSRVEDLREIIYGWAWNNNLIRLDE